MRNKETWHLQIVDAIEGFKKNITFLSDDGFSFKSIIQFANNNGFSENNTSGNQLLKKFLESETLDLKVNKIDKKLEGLFEEIESLGLYPNVIYKYGKGVRLKITYFKLFGPDIPYFLEKAKKIYFPESLEVQQLFGTDNVKLYEMWVPEYKKWVKETNKNHLKFLFKDISTNMKKEIEILG